jgi:hypothetical protein
MVNEHVGSVLQALSANNARVGKQAINGYRAATDYLVGRLDAGFTRMGATAGGRFTGYCAKAFERISESAEKIIVAVDHRASGTIGKVAAKVSKIGNARAARYVGFAGQVSLPPLRLARDVSAWIATRAESRLAPRVVKRSAVQRAGVKRPRKTAKAARKRSRAA